MNDKVIVQLVVPEINERYNIFLPVNKKIGTIIDLLDKSVNEMTNGEFPISKSCKLYNADTLQIYEANTLVFNSDIRNSTRLVLLSK